MFTNVSPTNSNMEMQLGPQMQTSTPIHSTFAQSNAPHILVNGQGQGHMNTQTTTTNQDMVEFVGDTFVNIGGITCGGP
jgi:hypothetical protein